MQNASQREEVCMPRVNTTEDTQGVAKAQAHSPLQVEAQLPVVRQYCAELAAAAVRYLVYHQARQ